MEVNNMAKFNMANGKLTITVDLSQLQGEEKLYSRDEALEYLGITRQTFSKKRKLAKVESAGTKGKYTQDQLNLIAKAR